MVAGAMQDLGSWSRKCRLVLLVSGMVRPRLGPAKQRQGQQSYELALLLWKGLCMCSRSAWVREAPTNVKMWWRANAYAVVKGGNHRALWMLNEKPKRFHLVLM